MNVSPLSKQFDDLLGKSGQPPDAKSLLQLTDQLRTAALKVANSGTTAGRPTDPLLGEVYYDTTLGSLVVATAVRAGATAAVWSGLGVKLSTPVVFTAGQSGTWTPPSAGIYFISAIAGGASAAGHAAGNANSSAGGGSAEYVKGLPVYADGTPWTYSVPAGVAGVTGSTNGVNGGSLTLTSSTFNIKLGGGFGGGSGRNGGSGGGRKGPVGAATVGQDAVQEGAYTFSGASAGGIAAAPADGTAPGTAEATPQAATATNDGTRSSSSAGAGSPWGLGGDAVAPSAGNSVAGKPGTAPGTGGSGVSGGTGNPVSGGGFGGQLEISG